MDKGANDGTFPQCFFLWLGNNFPALRIFDVETPLIALGTGALSVLTNQGKSMHLNCLERHLG